MVVDRYMIPRTDSLLEEYDFPCETDPSGPLWIFTADMTLRFISELELFDRNGKTDTPCCVG